ncbi:MAG: hypothetical protein WAL85_09865, partial [Candidatus Korobacteraceae bacterium]
FTVIRVLKILFQQFCTYTLAEEGMSKNLLKLLLGAAVFCAGIIIAQQPAQNVNPHHHPNLAAAQRLCEQAYQKIMTAQQDNEWDMQGHAAKAKDLLDQANQQLKLAAEAANKNHK